MAHTPGPWVVVEADVPPFGSFAIRNDHEAPGGLAITVGGLGEEERANAHLIAAAPELLEALKDIAGSNECCHFCSCHPHQALCVLTQLIAKAEGH